MRILLSACGLILISGCRDISSPVPVKPVEIGGRTVLTMACHAEVRSASIDCQKEGVGTPPEVASTLLGQGHVRLHSANVAYDTTTLLFSFDVWMSNLLPEPIGTPDGITTTGSKIFFESGPIATSFVPPHDSGSVMVMNASGAQSFTREAQPYFVYPEIVPPAGRTSSQKWQLRIPSSVNTFAFTLRVFTSRPSDPPVPAQAPDTVQEWIYDPDHHVTDLPDYTGTFVQDVVEVLFVPTATHEERMVALDQLRGEVVGGLRMSDQDGFYLVRVPSSPGGVDLAARLQTVRRLPQVMSAEPFPVESDNDVLLHLSPVDGTGFVNWMLHPDSADGVNWGLEAIGAPLAWGCETGDPTLRVAVVDAGFVTRAAPDIRSNQRYIWGEARNLPLQRGGRPTSHGNAVTSVIAAEGNNGTGATGVMWNAGLMLYEVAARRNGTVQYNAQGNYVLQSTPLRVGLAAWDNARVINVSIGANLQRIRRAVLNGTATRSDSNAIQALARRLDRTLAWQGLLGKRPLVVLAAGNDGVDAFWAGYPQVAQLKSDQVLVVGNVQQPSTASGTQWQLHATSNRGALVQIAAPGTRIGVLDHAGQVDSVTGTSFAAPFVTGAAGLLLSFDPSLSAGEVKQLLIAGAVRGGRRVPNLAGPPIPVLNVHESLMLLAERTGRRLCGNRVWSEAGHLRVQRGSGVETINSAPFREVSRIEAFHNGRTLRFDTEHGPRFANWWASGWSISADPRDTAVANGARAPVRESWWGTSHDGKSFAYASFSGTTVTVHLGDFGTGQSNPIASLTVLPSTTNGEWKCLFQAVTSDQPEPTCGDSLWAGSGQGTSVSDVAFSPRGDELYLAVNRISTATFVEATWSPCPIQPHRPSDPDATYTVFRCRGASETLSRTSGTIYAFSLRSGVSRVVAQETANFQSLAAGDGTSELALERWSGTWQRTTFWYEQGGANVKWLSEGGPIACVTQFRRQDTGAVGFSRSGCGDSGATMAPDRLSSPAKIGG